MRRAEQALCDSSFRDPIAAYEDGEYHVLERYWTQGHAPLPEPGETPEKGDSRGYLDGHEDIPF